MKKILWVSRHPPTRRQLLALGDVEIDRTTSPFLDAADVAERYRESGADDLVVVAPLSVLKALCQTGLHPLYAVMAKCSPAHPDKEVDIQRARGHVDFYRFVEFRRVLGLELKLEEKLCL